MYKDILVPIDITEENSWKASLPVVLDLAQAFKAKLHVMTVVSSYGMSIIQQYFPAGSIDEVVSKTNVHLHDFVKKHIPDTIEVQHIIAKGAVYECIIDTAEKINADLIVMSAHRPELKDYLLGPNAAKVVRHSNRSVLVVRDEKNS